MKCAHASQPPSYHIRHLGEVCAGDHICCLFDCEEEKGKVLCDFYKGGIERNEKMIFLGDTSSITEVVDLLEAGGITTIRDCVARGQFVVMHYADMYVRDGVFEPAKIIATLKSETEKSVSEGYTAVRGTGDMSWAFVQKDLTGKLMIYESMLNTFFSECVLGMCLYDTRLFAPDAMLQVLSTHPDAIIKGKLYHNIYYMPPDEYLGKNVQKAMLARWMNNIEERQNVEEQLIASKMEAEKAGQAKANFLATMSHEIRNPTNGLIGSADLLSQTKVSAEQEEYVNIIKSSAKHLYTVVNDVLDFSKLENGKLELERAPVDVEGCVKDSVGLCQYTTQKNLAVHVVHTIDPACPKVILGDATRLRQILVNLIGNACKFCEQGDIVVAVRPLPTSSLGTLPPLPPDREAYLEFSVSDHGYGISETDQARLFQKFSQVDVVRKWAGTGLGLAICKQLVEAMQGRIFVRSKIGQGSTFYFCIPISTPSGDYSYVDSTVNNAIDNDNNNDVIISDACNKVENKAFNNNVDNYNIINSQGDVKPAIKTDNNTNNSVDSKVNSNADNKADSKMDSKVNNKADNKPDNKMDNKAENKPDNKADNKPNIKADNKVDSKADSKSNNKTDINKVDNKTGVNVDNRVDNSNKINNTGNKTSATSNAANTMAIAKPGDTSDFSVLVVEDNLMNQKIMKRMLEKIGCGVDLAENGLQAIEAAKNKNYSVIFMDMYMPECDGYTAAQRIRENFLEHKAECPKIVAFTGTYETRLSDGVMDDVLLKPVLLNSLASVVDKFCHKETVKIPALLPLK